MSNKKDLAIIFTLIHSLDNFLPSSNRNVFNYYKLYVIIWNKIYINMILVLMHLFKDNYDFIILNHSKDMKI